MDKECKDKCLSAGIALGREQQSFKAGRTTPVIFAENIAKLLPEDAMKVPHSELAMHVGAAGKEVLAYVLAGNYAFVVFDNDGCCEMTHGLPGEVLSPQLEKTTREMWGPPLKIIYPTKSESTFDPILAKWKSAVG